MIDKIEEYIYESPDAGKTIYKRVANSNKIDRELVFATRELGTIADHDLIKDLCEKYPNYQDLGKAVMEYYKKNLKNG
jgi:hypothetical protein